MSNNTNTNDLARYKAKIQAACCTLALIKPPAGLTQADGEKIVRDALKEYGLIRDSK